MGDTDVDLSYAQLKFNFYPAKPMKYPLLKTVIVTLAMVADASLHAANITVFAAASLSDSLKAIAADYQKSSGDRIIFNFGASSTLARQIEEGAPADIFFSADESKMNALVQKGLIDTSTRVSRLGNALVVVTGTNSSLKIESVYSLTNAGLKRLALADPKAVPAGVYARQWMEKFGLWSAMQPKIVPTENVRGALAAVESENVDAGVVYKTDAGISRKVKIIYEVPSIDSPRISYPMALVKETKVPNEAKRFLTHLNSDAAGRVFENYGFLLPK